MCIMAQTKPAQSNCSTQIERVAECKDAKLESR